MCVNGDSLKIGIIVAYYNKIEMYRLGSISSDLRIYTMSIKVVHAVDYY